MPFVKPKPLYVNDHVDRDPREPYLPLSECAEQMGISVEQVKRLVAAGVLWSRWSRSGMLVQPV